MKKYIGLIICLCSLSLWAQDHQDFEREHVSFSIKTGWVNSTLAGNDKDFLAIDGKIESENNFKIGLSVDNPIGKNFAFKHEIFYQNYGGNFDRAIDNHIFNADLKMRGLRINPISLAYRFVDLHVFTGPYMNILLNSSLTAIDENGNIYKDHNIFGTEIDDQDGSHFLQNMDYGVLIGAEYQFDFGGILGIEFSRGLATIFDNANAYENHGPDAPKDLKLYNQQLSVYLGYKF